jgi:hypothetical protein
MITLRRDQFVAEYLSGTEPVLVSDGLEDWPATRRWSPTFLAAAAHGNIDVAVSLTGSFRYTPDGGALDADSQFIVRGIPFKDAADRILDEAAGSPKYYISQQDVRAKLPELLPDLCFPRVGEPARINLWFGSAGTVTPLHFDTSNNLYAQIYGSKRFTVFSPQETQYLHPFPAGSRLQHLSYMDLENPDAAQDASVQRARRTTFTIEPGQLLFLPAYWWHHVRSNGISISVSQWWAPTPAQCSGPNAQRFKSGDDAPQAPDSDERDATGS